RRPRVALGVGAIAGIPHVGAVERRDVVHRDGRDGRGDATGEVGRVEIGDGAGAAAAAADVFPEALAADTERRDDADARDDDPGIARVAHDCNLYYLVIWLSGYLVVWLSGHLVIWLSGYLVIWSIRL